MTCSYVTFDREDVGQLSIVDVGPNMRIVSCFDQLHIDAHRIAALLHAAFQNVGNAKLLGDLRQVFRRALVVLRGGTRDDLKIGDLR